MGILQEPRRLTLDNMHMCAQQASYTHMRTRNHAACTTHTHAQQAWTHIHTHTHTHECTHPCTQTHHRPPSTAGRVLRVNTLHTIPGSSQGIHRRHYPDQIQDLRGPGTAGHKETGTSLEEAQQHSSLNSPPFCSGVLVNLSTDVQFA